MKDYYKEGIKEEYKDYYIDDLGYIRKTYKVPFLAATIISAVVTLIIAIVLINKISLYTNQLQIFVVNSFNCPYSILFRKNYISFKQSFFNKITKI